MVSNYPQNITISRKASRLQRGNKRP